MRKINILLAVAIIAAVGLNAQEITRLRVKVQAANVRSEPDTNGAIVKRVDLGMTLESRQKIGEWFEIVVLDEKGTPISGYIHGSVVDIVGPGGAQPAAGFPAKETTVLRVKIQTATVRAEPDPNGAVVKYVTSGTQLEPRQKLGEWYEIVVTDEKKTSISAYIHSSVVDVVSPGGAQPAAGAQPQEKSFLAVKVQTANVRTEPDSNSAIVKYVTLGTQFDPRQKIGEWYEILVADEKGTMISGYVHSSVVDVVGPGGVAPVVRPVQPPVERQETPPTTQVAYPSPTIRVPAQWPSVMIFGRYGSFSPTDENFKSIYGGGSVFGGELRLRVASGFYLSLAGGVFKGTGVLTLTKQDTTLTIYPLDAMVVYHFLSGSILPYLGAGGAVCKYKEENAIGTVDKWGFGFGFCGGVTARWKSLGVDARVKYTSVKIKPLEDEAGLGGLTLSIGAGVLF